MGNTNIKHYASLISLAFLVFQNLTLNFGHFKSTLISTSTLVDYFCTSDEVTVCGVHEGR